MIRNLALTLTVLALSVGVLTMTLLRLDPMGTQKELAYIAFFISLFCGVGALMTLVFFFGTEVLRGGRRLGTRVFLVAVRRGVLCGFFACGMVLLRLLRLLSPFEGALLAIFLILIELIFASSTKK